MHAHHDHEHHDHAPAHGGHAGDPQGRAGERRKLAFAIGVALVILLAEVAGGIISHSLALLSDAGHMFSDVISEALSLAAMIIATRPSDARRTYGWHRLEILAALVNGVVLFALSGEILWSAWQRVHAPVPVDAKVVLVVASFGLSANLAGAWLLHGARSLTARSAYLHILLDGLSSAGVLVGAAVMAVLHGAYWLDPVLSMAIGVFILYGAYRLVREAVDVLLEAVPRNIDLAGVTHALDHTDGVRAVHDLHIWSITSGLYALSAHLVVEGVGHDQVLAGVQAMLQRDFSIAHCTLQIESAEFDHTCHIC